MIDYFRLKKSHGHNAFDLYCGDEMLCIISGIGKIAAAAATAWVAALNQHSTSIAWINIGTAGSGADAIGTAFWINKITDQQSNRHYYPLALFNPDFESRHCVTLNQPSSDYQARELYDMEASSFFETATRFSSAELVHNIKIISDNGKQQIGRCKPTISYIIEQQLATLVKFSEALTAINNQFSAYQLTQLQWLHFKSRARFSQSQQSQLKHSLRFLLNRNYNLDSLSNEISGLDSSQSILQHLEQLCFQNSRNL